MIRKNRDHIEERARRRDDRRDAASRRLFRQSRGEVLVKVRGPVKFGAV